MRYFFLLPFLLVLSLTAFAVEAPSGQISIGSNQILRGHFVQGGQIQSSGHFVAAPAYGLIWTVEKPFPTSTIITSKGAVQDIGGMPIKLPIKNLRHLYEMIGGALTGDWNGLEADYIITAVNNADHWQMLLTPRHNSKSTLTYTSIAVSGERFVESITMVKADGSADILNFTNEALASSPLTAGESVAFNEAGQ